MDTNFDAYNSLGTANTVYIYITYLYILIHIFIKNISRSLHNKNLSRHQTKINTVHTKSGNEQ